MHTQLPPGVLCEYLRSLRRLVSLRGSTPIHRWSFFAGGGISCKLLEVYDEFLLHRVNIGIEHKGVVLAEIDPWKLICLKTSVSYTFRRCAPSLPYLVILMWFNSSAGPCSRTRRSLSVMLTTVPRRPSLRVSWTVLPTRSSLIATSSTAAYRARRGRS